MDNVSSSSSNSDMDHTPKEGAGTLTNWRGGYILHRTAPNADDGVSSYCSSIKPHQLTSFHLLRSFTSSNPSTCMTSSSRILMSSLSKTASH
ncbi:hypothetical protein DCAR_0104964 [Daucus carota subsp. sativus]|uniref:Uncharacterized protein n=1 Tax=Daucus carota subsp. sativus TaxID=79200 RepID=A0A166J9A2_DAUCS|nr:hypothetical protein DCAR_0104964 [Daucus carota subsp. sativus]